MVSPRPTRTPPADAARAYEVISVSLPRDLIRRANTLIPRSRRSRVIAAVLRAFLDSIAARKVAEEYVAYYTRRSVRDANDERDLLEEWRLADDEAWRVLERETRRGGQRPPR